MTSSYEGEEAVARQLATRLNELLRLDELAVTTMCLVRVPCRPDSGLVDHPDCVVVRDEDGTHTLGLVGLLNGLVHLPGNTAIRMVADEETGRVLRFDVGPAKYLETRHDEPESEAGRDDGGVPDGAGEAPGAAGGGAAGPGPAPGRAGRVTASPGGAAAESLEFLRRFGPVRDAADHDGAERAADAALDRRPEAVSWDDWCLLIWAHVHRMRGD